MKLERKKASSSPEEKLKAISKEMKENFLEMDHVIEGVLVSLLGEQNILLISPPGAAKSQVSRYLAKTIGGKFFERLMHKYQTPDDLFGPIDIVALKVDKKFQRMSKNTLSDADIVLLDEIWKSSSAIINTLLMAVNERIHTENGGTVKLPLKMAIGCSNEYPQGDELRAIYDRFNVKFELSYLQEMENFKALLKTKDQDPEPTTVLGMNELQELIDKAKGMEMPESVIEFLAQLKMALEEKGIINSPRRWKKAVRVLKAVALFHGNSRVEREDLLFLVNVLWNHPEQRSVVAGIITSLVNPYLQAILELYDMGKALGMKINSLPADGLIEARAKLASIREDITKTATQAAREGKPVRDVAAMLDELKNYQKQVVEKLTA